ncbi:hypothetical protein CAPTEDRAFT_188227 [Capitella teleta]|uniref:Uncharacterized protein n=1 Tax=Capitella teleta TaxID=283909 RepID=R7TFE1_CAPTE|nr:hypothetical protein CAPTEDRAFT_188227 [Capitella teleta]|eukprot:ELT92217.1 hypothetical protein CAPTEDRAFT_188227 [Capitella teleta]
MYRESTDEIEIVSNSENEELEVNENDAINLRNDAPRGREFASQIKLLRKKRGMCRTFKVQPGGTLERFSEYLVSQRVKAAAANATAVNRLLHWLHCHDSRKGGKLDLTLLFKHAMLEEYFRILGSDLDGSGRSIGLLATSIKNEFASLGNFIRFIRRSSHPSEDLNAEDVGRLEIWLDDKKKLNLKDQARYCVQKNTKQVALGQGLSMSLLDKAITNAYVEAELETLRKRYKDSRTRCSDCNDFTFMFSYIINSATLISLSRSGVIGGLTLKEFKDRKQVTVNGERWFALVVAHH